MLNSSPRRCVSALKNGRFKKSRLLQLSHDLREQGPGPFSWNWNARMQARPLFLFQTECKNAGPAPFLTFERASLPKDTNL